MGSRDKEIRFLMGVKFPVEMHTKDDEMAYGFYHITKKENKADIAKNGLVPKSPTDKGEKKLLHLCAGMWYFFWLFKSIAKVDLLSLILDMAVSCSSVGEKDAMSPMCL